MLTHLRFAALPKPKETDWELELPEEQLDISTDVERSEEDAAERDRRDKAVREAAERAAFRRRTTVMQRSLPRLAQVDIDALVKIASTVEDPIETIIAQEAALLISDDALRYPVPGAKINGSSHSLETFDDEDLSRARLAITHELSAEDVDTRQKAFESMWKDVQNYSKLPGLPGYSGDKMLEYQRMVETFNVSHFLYIFIRSISHPREASFIYIPTTLS